MSEQASRLSGEMNVATQAVVKGYQEADVRSYARAASPMGNPYVVRRDAPTTATQPDNRQRTRLAPCGPG